MLYKFIKNDGSIYTIIETNNPETEMDYLNQNMNAGISSYEQYILPETPFDVIKEKYLNMLGAEFAKRRDAVRWINLPSGNRYGFDCAVEDISNFMAAYTPLLIAGSGETGYKVWKSETEKGLVILTFDDMQAAYTYVRESQLSAYAWLASSQAKINAVTETEGKEKLQAVYDACVATPTKEEVYYEYLITNC